MIDYILVFLYLLIALVSGLRSSRGVKDMQDYSISNKKYSTPVLVATTTATVIGAENILSLAQGVFEQGIIYILINLTLVIDLFLIAKIIAPKMHPFQGMISVGDIMESFYGKTAKVATGIAGFFLCVGFVGAQVSAIGYLSGYLYDISPVIGIMLGAGIVTVYSALGGIRAVTRTDVIQFLCIVFSVPLILNITLHMVSGYGFLSWIQALPESHISIMPQEKSVLRYVSLCILFAIPLLDPAFIQRILMSRDTKQIQTTFRLVTIIGLTFLIFISALGLAATLVVPQHHDVIAYLISDVLPRGVKGLAIAGLLAIIMSTADSYLNAGSISFAHDCIKPLLGKRLSGEKELVIARLTTVLIGVGSIIAALTKESIMDIVLMFCGIWAPIVVVPLISGILGYQSTQRGFVWAMLGGLFTTVIWSIYIEPILDIESILPSMLVNGCILFINHKKRAKPVVPPNLLRDLLYSKK